MTAEYNYIIDTGTVVADTSALLADVQQEFRNALGASINLAPSTPQGTLVTAETLARTSVMKNNAELANTINPNLSYGTFLDAICSLMGISRGADQSTVGTGVKITGTSGTVIVDGSRVRTANNDIYIIVGNVNIPISGETTATIKSEAPGPIPLAVGAMTIIDGTIGWGTAEVVVTTVVTLGVLALNDPQLKNKRNLQLAKQGTGSSAAIKAAVLDVANVTSANVVENNTGATGIVNGVDFTLPNAVWVCVDGTPAQADVAAALYDAHSAGCPWDFGDTGMGVPVNPPNGVSTIDPSTGLSYNVKWVTPNLYDCYVHITINQGNAATSQVPSVQNAIMNFATGQEAGEQGFVIGASVSAFEVAGAVARQLPGLYIRNCLVAVVPTGSPAPVYPGDYVTEFVMPQYGRAVQQINRITVVLV